ncbi:Zinc finger, RING/FYVE/PHD-type [Penicillium griseofulvum]|uniref:Zinc finger, RING/FYVE/PHD-type n=1 Tax=Penicillium patulum TaxID=5078 RepID=A0A135LEW4_PENPA|nr:Zinc finger, RING/FYVE/PHD-type [Penicillium griseofulvum]KXG47518.1 Zinc finger, RING/FYVE/PHD-type [Penicillium griseofulvum]
MSQDDRGDKPEGFSKYLKRMKTVLRPRSISKRQSVAGVVAPAETAKETAPAPAPASAPAPAAVPTPTLAPVSAPVSAPISAPVSAPAPAQDITLPEPVMYTDFKTTQNEKARALFAKYGLTIDTSEWKTPTDLQVTRVTKPIRMRVRRTCHRCETTFGAEKVCVNCQHTRCTKCPRYPPARKDGEPRKPKMPETYERLFPRTSHLKLSTTKEISLKMPSPTGGADFVHRPVRQRIHRYCHVCTSLYTPGIKECPKCSHVRCKICPRDPAKLDKYPDGYPGDADPPKPRPERTWKKPRRRIHYECHVCQTWFQGNVDTCSNCGQVKCEKTIRIPAKKVKPETSPEVLKSLEQKLAAMALEQEPGIAETA